jgi:hypothetical protein
VTPESFKSGAGGAAGTGASAIGGSAALEALLGAGDFGKLNRKGFLVDGRKAAAAVRSRRRSVWALKSSARWSLSVAWRATAPVGAGALPCGVTATKAARIPPPPNQSAFNVVLVITTDSS